MQKRYNSIANALDLCLFLHEVIDLWGGLTVNNWHQHC